MNKKPTFSPNDQHMNGFVQCLTSKQSLFSFFYIKYVVLQIGQSYLG